MRALIVLLAACVHVPVSTQPNVLAMHARELGDRGFARIDVDEGGTIVVPADRPVTITIPGNERLYAWGLIKTGTPDETRAMTVGTLVSGCATGGDCMASRVRGPILVGEQRRFDARNFAIGMFGAVATALSVTCLVKCSNLNGWALVGTGLGAVTLMVPLASFY